MKNNIRMLSANGQERKHKGLFTPLVFGSVALFLCMEVSAGECRNAAGGIGICVDGGQDVSQSLGIGWNGVRGTEVYQPIGKNKTLIQDLTFKFGQTQQTSKMSEEDLLITISGKKLEISGGGRGLQMGSGDGDLKFVLESNHDKQIILDLGSTEKNEKHAFEGNLTIDGSSSVNTVSGWLNTFLSLNSFEEKGEMFSGIFRGKGIKGDLNLRAFGEHSLTFGTNALLEGKIILEAGKTNIKPTNNSLLLIGGIYSSKGQGTLIFQGKDISISGRLGERGESDGDSAIITTGGNIDIIFQEDKQNIKIQGTISTINHNRSGSNIVIKTNGDDTKLTLSGVRSEVGSNGVHIILSGNNSALSLTKEIPKDHPHSIEDFNFQGSGNITTEIKGLESKIIGDVSFIGEGANTITFAEQGDIVGDIIVSKSNVSTTIPQGSSEGNIILFKKSGNIDGNIYSYGGRNTITFENKDQVNPEDMHPFGINGKICADGHKEKERAENIVILKSKISQINGIEVNGENSAINKINIKGGDLIVNAINFGDGIGNALYAKNSMGSNKIDVDQGSLTINGDIVSIAGENVIHVKGYESINFGNQSTISIFAEDGQNIFSFDNQGENNSLKLKTIQADGGQNYLGRKLIYISSDSEMTHLNDEDTLDFFSGTMEISQGISTKSSGKNTILFHANKNQDSSIIYYFDDSHSNYLSLKNAISGNNDIILDVSNSSLFPFEQIMQSYLVSPQSPEKQKELGKNSVIFGNIASEYGDSFVLVTGNSKNTETKVKSAVFGNIITNNGSNGVFMEDAIIVPSEIISANGTASLIGGKLSGNFITTSGESNIVTSITSNPFGMRTLVYNLDAQGGTTNIVFEGDINTKINIKQAKGSKVSLFFDPLKGQDYSFKHNNLSELKSTPIGVYQENGFEVELIKNQNHAFQTKIESQYENGIHNLILQAIVIGKISSFSERQQSIVFEENTYFIGEFNIQSQTKVITNHSSKIILKDFTNQNPKNNFEIPTLTISNKKPTSRLNPNTTVNLASTPGLDTNFGLLTIGQENHREQNTGLQGESGAMFIVGINTIADQGNATLGGEKINNGNGSKGYAYSDRIIIANIGDNSKAQEGVYYLGIHLDDQKILTDVKYDSSNDNQVKGGGSKQKGNIAVLTVVNTDDNKAGIDLKIRDIIEGFDKIGGGLTTRTTDIHGEVGSEKTGFTTYFLTSMTTNGPTNERNKVSSSALMVNYDLFFTNINSLNKRMGELRDNPYSQGVWARIFGGAQSNDFGLGTKTNYVTLQAGYDYAFGFEGANNYLGIALSYSTSHSVVQNSLTQDLNHEVVGFEGVKSHGVEVALYNAYVQDEGWYNDSIFKFSYITSSFSIFNQTPLYSTHNLALTLSDEFGYRFKLGEEKEWFIDPQFELTFGYFNQSELKQTLGDSWLNSIADALFTLRSRFGSSFGYDFKKFTEHKPISASVYVGAFYEYDYVVGGDVFSVTNLGGESKSSSVISSDERVVLNVGTNMTIKDNTRLCFDFEKSFAGKITTDYQLNVGVRYSFGENMGYMPVDPNKKSTAPLKIRDESESEVDEEANHENKEGNKGEHNENRDGAKEEKKGA